ncbi:MAG: flagellar protein FlaG [Nitrospira sp.]|nr:flagellar protein FlaG [Nitrospira sp.]
MITPVSNKADLLTMPRKGGEPDIATAKRPDAAWMQPDSQQVENSPRAESERPDPAVLERAAVKVNDALMSAGTQVKLFVDQGSEQVVVKVLKESGELLRQFPPEELLELAEYLSEEQTLPAGKGLLVEERV